MYPPLLPQLAHGRWQLKALEMPFFRQKPPFEGSTRVHYARGPILVGTRPQRGGGGGTPPLFGPQNCRTEQCALSAPEAPQILFQAYGGGGGFFCSTPCVYTQNTQNFVENSKMAEKHKKVM